MRPAKSKSSTDVEVISTFGKFDFIFFFSFSSGHHNDSLNQTHYTAKNQLCVRPKNSVDRIFFSFFLEILNQVANKSWFRWHAVTRDFTKSKSSTPVKLSAARESPWIGFWKMRNMLAPRYFFPRRDIERERERESSKICRYFNRLCFQGISSSHPRPPPFPLYPFLFIHHHS